MVARLSVILVVLSICFSHVAADDTLYRYEANVSPCDKSTGWTCGNPCEEPCSDSVENGRYVLRWKRPPESVGYALFFAKPGTPPPPTFWVEWQFRSNHPIGPNFYTCDGAFSVRYGEILAIVHMYGDAAISNSADDVVVGLDLTQSHTYRFESTDGRNYWIAVDGRVFIEDIDSGSKGHFLALHGGGSCEDFLNTINEWDFVRYGTIATGEQIVASDPPAGFLDPQVFSEVDRFTVTFDSANYVYVDDITVEVTGGIAPIVLQTRRRENTEPDTVEIVLDGPMPMGEATTFTITDGEATSVITYTFASGDTNDDGRVDLREMQHFQNCFGTFAPSGLCQFLDVIPDDNIDFSDLRALLSEMSGP